MGHLTPLYSELIENPYDFDIKVVSGKYSKNNELSTYYNMFEYFNTYCFGTEIHIMKDDNVDMYNCTCVGYIKASDFIKHYDALMVDKKLMRIIFYLWEVPFLDSELNSTQLIYSAWVGDKYANELKEKIINILTNINTNSIAD